MASVALLPAIAILAGTSIAVSSFPFDRRGLLALVVLYALAWGAWRFRRPRATLVLTLIGYALAGALLGGAAARDALAPPLRVVLDRALSGFALDTPGPASLHDPLLTRGRLIEDASHRDDGVVIRVEVETVRIAGREHPARGGLLLNVTGAATGARIGEWRAGRLIQAPVTFRRPARYLNDGVRDFERDLALDGIALVGTAKSALLVDVMERGSAVQEIAAAVRARVRRSVARWVGADLSGAIVTAILIGDRTGLPDEVRVRLQAAGTYHVIAISGGNIAILAAAIVGVLALAGVGGRAAALSAIVALVAYAAIVTSGPSVWRATLMAIVYFAARVIDHRSPPWNAMAASGAILACAAPLDVRDVGFALTFGATAAILEISRRVRDRMPAHPALAFAVASIAASLAAEIVLLPISAFAFSRVTAAGLVLNLLAVPLMTVAQLAGLIVLVAAPIGWIAGPAGVIAALSAAGLVESARLVDAAPWLTMRVPPPGALLTAAYYISVLVILFAPARARVFALVMWCACAAAILAGPRRLPLSTQGFGPAGATVRFTVFDVGQGDAMLLQAPGGIVMIDSGGAPFGGGPDIGARVLAPALWARGVRRLDTLVLTHGDPDHIGGARSLLADFAPAAVWQGIPVARHRALEDLLASARAAGMIVAERYTGARVSFGPVQIRVLHPDPPDWARQRVRNDDSVVLEVRYEKVALLLTGDIGADTERALVPRLSPARMRILKVAHHGSRTSTSAELLAAWKPQVAVISCGRGNRFGHPAPEVLTRLQAIGANVFRTDRDGQITIETDGKEIRTWTFVSARKQ